MSDAEGAASRLIGPNPRGAVRTVSLAVRAALAAGIPPGDEGGAGVLIGVSGGADSTALAVCAIDVCRRRGVPVRTLTVDHGLREGSAAEAHAVADVLEHWGARAEVVRVSVATGGPFARTGGPEAAAREARRRALAQAARRLTAQTGRSRVLVLLGHTMDDQAETVLLRLARGSGAGSLRAMAARAPWPDGGPGCEIARPLLGVRRANTHACCEALGLTVVEDPTNQPDGPWRAADGSALRRAAVRARALPVLAEALGVDPVPALARTAELCARDDDALEAQADVLWRRCARPHAASHPLAGPHAVLPAAPSQEPPTDPTGTGVALVVDLDATELAAAPAAVAARVVRRAILAAGGRAGDVTSLHVQRVLALAADRRGQGPADLPGTTARRLPGGAVRVGG